MAKTDQSIQELLTYMTIDQIREFTCELRKLVDQGHGELILMIKNGEVCYLGTSSGRSIRKLKGKTAE